MKYFVDFSLIFLGIAKEDCVIKTREMSSFLPLINHSVATGLRFLLLNMSAIISSKTSSILRFLFGLYSSMLYKYNSYYSGIQ